MTDTHIVWKHHLVPLPPSTSSTETLPPFSRSCTLCLPSNTSSETECRPSLLHRTLPNLLTAHPGISEHNVRTLGGLWQVLMAISNYILQAYITAQEETRKNLPHTYICAGHRCATACDSLRPVLPGWYILAWCVYDVGIVYLLLSHCACAVRVYELVNSLTGVL